MNSRIHDSDQSAESIRDAVWLTGVPGLPDFRNLGVLLRLLLGVNVLGVAAVVVQQPDPGSWLAAFLELGFRLEPTLLLTTVVLAASQPLLARWPLMLARAGIVAGTAFLALLLEGLWRVLWLSELNSTGDTLRVMLLAGGTAGLMLAYFELRARAGRPAVGEAQLAALTARIRPHFLFNSLNAVLALIRTEPRRAESALEDLADLFRAVLKNPRARVPLSEEFEFCRQYLDLERLRLGDRLRVSWDIAAVPHDLRVPPLMLQPLLENAVVHGIEPLGDGGTVSIAVARDGDRLVIRVRNPLSSQAGQFLGGGRQGEGHHMALRNIRERLALFFDLEAELRAGVRDGEWEVSIRLPWRVLAA